MKQRLDTVLLLFLVIVTVSMLSPKQGLAAIGSNISTNLTNNQNLEIKPTLSDAVKKISELNSDGKLNVQITPFSNASTSTRNGTMKLGTSNVKITYERTPNGIDIVDGDMLLAPEVAPSPGNGSKIAIDRFINSKPWTNGDIPVIINNDIPNRQRILDAMAYVESVTPIRFKPVTINDKGDILDPNYLRFVKSPATADDCYTYAGMVAPSSPIFAKLYPDGRYRGQPVMVASWCDTPSLVHEIGHDLGLWHEQKRCDRDQYIEMIWSNIERKAWPQYSTLCDPSHPEGSPSSPGNYDYCSIMHYKQYSGFAINRDKPVFSIKKPIVGCQEKDVGHSKVYSPADIRGIASVYSFVQR